MKTSWNVVKQSGALDYQDICEFMQLHSVVCLLLDNDGRIDSHAPYSPSSSVQKYPALSSRPKKLLKRH
ncbi:hypothetical protein M6D81_09965, partial [Paenibacillus sp. J5C_2022]|nr:hypothetical protein [Paenibacillus sp. J5C2022]